MKDFLKNYRKKKILSNTGIIFTSLVLAFGINFFVIDSTNVGNNLKASVINSKSNKELSDLYIDYNGDKISIRNSKNIENITKLSLSFNYNPENITIKKITSSIQGLDNILNLNNEPGINSIIISFKGTKNIDSKTNIIDIELNKEIEKSESLNLINSNFIDSDGKNYSLSTSGVSF